MLTKEEVEHIATLARIDLSLEEKEQFQVDLSKALILFDELGQLDTEHEEGIGHITGRVNEARSDRVLLQDKNEQDIIRQGFPEKEGSFAKVKAVFSEK
jgi:aspartyl-tRNA(Asn)/glutamyl-tRNA(Gln) amidotransferase subunit C